MELRNISTDKIVVRSSRKRFSGLIIKAFYTGTIIGHVVYTAGRQVYPSIGDATKDNVLRDIYIDDKGQRNIPFPVKGYRTNRILHED